jgi:glycosyltransferase involved in cell wall biosynthesis
MPQGGSHFPMSKAQDSRARVSAVIPAYNEAATIGPIVAVLGTHPLVEEIIVVSDGSTDETAACAARAGARVIALHENRGKAAALAAGVRAARSDILLFIDADLTGLTPQIITRLITPVSGGLCDMFVALRDRRVYWVNQLLRYTPIISGERALARHVWDRVPPRYLKNFQIEIALNFFAKSAGARMKLGVIAGLGHVIKERKRGVWSGLWQRTLMIRDVLVVAWRLYVVYQGLVLLRPEPEMEKPELQAPVTGFPDRP